MAAQHAGRGGTDLLRQPARDLTPHADAVRCGARLCAVGSAGDDVVGRRGAAGQARK